MVKNLTAMQETWVQSLDPEDPLEEGMATHSSILAWEIPWTEEQEYWSESPCPPPGNLLDPGIKPASLMSLSLTGRFFTTSATYVLYKITTKLSLGSAGDICNRLDFPDTEPLPNDTLIPTWDQKWCFRSGDGGAPGQDSLSPTYRCIT